MKYGWSILLAVLVTIAVHLILPDASPLRRIAITSLLMIAMDVSKRTYKQQ